MKRKDHVEELVAIVGRLAEKYTGYESTSLSYEKAEQLMEAVLYCISEVELCKENAVLSIEEQSVQKMYERGVDCVEKKVKKALDIYHEILPQFMYYQNKYLYDTFIKGLPEFFKRYDIKFEPQNTILTLDYPVLKDLSKYRGIDKIYAYIICIDLEQKFLRLFSESDIIQLLRRYHSQYQDIADNLCEIVFTDMIGHMLAKKPLSEQEFDQKDILQIEKVFMQMSLQEIKQQLEDAVVKFIEQYYNGCEELTTYLFDSMDGILIRLKNAEDHFAFRNVLRSSEGDIP